VNELRTAVDTGSVPLHARGRTRQFQHLLRTRLVDSHSTPLLSLYACPLARLTDCWRAAARSTHLHSPAGLSRGALCLQEVEQGGDTAVIGRRRLVINCGGDVDWRASNQRPRSAGRAAPAFISPVLNQSSILLADRQSVSPSTATIAPLSGVPQVIAMSETYLTITTAWTSHAKSTRVAHRVR